MTSPASNPACAALYGLEGPIFDMRDLALLLDMAADATVYRRDAAVEALVQEKAGLSGYHVCVMSEDQSRALDFILHRVVEQARKVQREYDAALAKVRQPPTPLRAEGGR